MKAVILAGGVARKMFPLTDSRPKAMLRIANKPLVEYVMMTAKSAGIKDFVFIVGYKNEQIRDYFGNGKKWGVKITYRTQEESIGTADALKHAEDVLTEPFLLIHSDVMTSKEDLKQIIGCEGMAIGIKKSDDTKDYGTVVNKRGYAKKFIEKAENSESDYINTGIYKLDPSVFKAIDETPISVRGEYELPESIQILVDQFKGKIKCIEIKEWMNITRPWDLLDLNEKIFPKKGLIEGTVEENVHLDGNIIVGKGTIIRSGAYITGNVIIGENCDIGPSCRIRGTTSIGNGCHVGSFVDLKNSIIMDGSKIPHLNYVGDTVIGERCNFGAGSKIANLRFDHKEIADSSRHKLGALIGDDVNIGINACVNAGTFIGNNAIIGPGVLASGTIMPKCKVF